VRAIYSTLFGVTGGRVVPGEALFPEGKPPEQLPKISLVINKKGAQQ
jgi:hypothetical protein